MKIYAFADEANPSVDGQIVAMTRNGLNGLEIRGVDGTNVAEITLEKAREVRAKMDAAGLETWSIGSPIGKIDIEKDDFEAHMDKFRHTLEVAKILGAKNIRLFSFFIPEGDNPDDHRDEVLSRTRAMVALAEEGGITLLHENEKGIYGDSPQRVRDLMLSINSPRYRAIYDAANYVQTGFRPFDESWPLVRDYVDYIHIKDVTVPSAEHPIGVITPAGQGAGQYPELLAELQRNGFEGFLSIEPHLGDFDEFGGLCGPDLWTSAHAALTAILDGLDIRYN